MIIGGLQKFSLLDYPGCMSAIVFTQGCNFRCHFCYNPMLVCPNGNGCLNTFSADLSDEKVGKVNPRIFEDDLFDFLKKRVGKLDAVVITGGEPTLHQDLPGFIGKIRNFGFKIKLDTNGTNPKMLEDLYNMNLIDYVAMDLKGTYEKYAKVVSAKLDIEDIKKSIDLIMESGVGYEFRTTLVPGLHELRDMKDMGKMIQGADKWYLQDFKSDVELMNDEFVGKKGFCENELDEMVKIGKEFVQVCERR